MDTQSLTVLAREIVTDFPEISLVYLFGSRVSGHTGVLSDYDFAILVDQHADGPAIRDRFAGEVGVRLQTNRVDVVLLRRAFIELAYAVIAEGIVLFERGPVTRIEFEAMVMSRYGDYLPILRAQREQILRETDHEPGILRYRAALGQIERTLGQIAGAANR